jgi:hypothetical protein
MTTIIATRLRTSSRKCLGEHIVLLYFSFWATMVFDRVSLSIFKAIMEKGEEVECWTYNVKVQQHTSGDWNVCKVLGKIQWKGALLVVCAAVHCKRQTIYLSQNLGRKVRCQSGM